MEFARKIKQPVIANQDPVRAHTGSARAQFLESAKTLLRYLEQGFTESALLTKNVEVSLVQRLEEYSVDRDHD